MEYPTLYVKQKNRQMTDAFLGYNHNLRIGDNEFYDMKNMTSDYYPVLAPRKSRGVYSDTHANGIISKNKLCYVDVDDGAFFVGDDKIDMTLSTGQKNVASLGSYVIIMPDKKYINTEPNIVDGKKVYEWGSVDAEFKSTNDIEFSMSDITGEKLDYDNVIENTEPPAENPVPNGQLWIDTSSTPNTLKKYSASTKTWATVSTTYVRISHEKIGEHFKQYDGVVISGITVDGLTELNGNHTVWGVGTDYIVISGIVTQIKTQVKESGKITVTRKMPQMDFIIESNNRLWGCRYGTNDVGEMINEIYASKLGDFKNWNCFMGISTDSYAASCGTDGPFTGAISHQGYPLFFKENCVHKVYGNYPANFQIQPTDCRGVQPGSSKSLSVVNETLFYKSTTAICAYDGSLPVEISTALGDVRYSAAVACGHGNKYYINMKNANGEYSLFVYDTLKGLWHKEDNIRIDEFCSHSGELYAIDNETKKVITMLGSGSIVEESVPWMVESGLMGMATPDMKYISKLLIRMSIDKNASVSVSIQYDSNGKWEKLCDISTTTLRSLSIPILPRRCDHFRLRIDGDGNGRIYSITKTIEQGSDVS